MKLTDFLLLVVIALLIWLVLHPTPPSQTTTYHYDTTVYNIPVTVKPPTVTIQNEIPQNLDTNEILKNYFQTHLYSDTISDTAITAHIRDSIGLNRLLHRSFSYRINRPTTVNTFQKEKKIRLFIGGYSTFDSTANVGISAAVQLKGWQVEAGRNLNNKQYLIGIKKEL